MCSGTGQKVLGEEGGLRRSREGVGHQFFSRWYGVGCSIFSYSWGWASYFMTNIQSLEPLEQLARHLILILYASRSSSRFCYCIKTKKLSVLFCFFTYHIFKSFGPLLLLFGQSLILSLLRKLALSFLCMTDSHEALWVLTGIAF